MGSRREAGVAPCSEWRISDLFSGLIYSSRPSDLFYAMEYASAKLVVLYACVEVMRLDLSLFVLSDL